MRYLDKKSPRPRVRTWIERTTAGGAVFHVALALTGLIALSPGATAQDLVLGAAAPIGGTFVDGGQGVGVDGSGNVYLGGYFTDTADLDPTAGVASFTSTGQQDIYVIKLDASGAFQWARAVGGTDSDILNDLTVDAAGNVFMTGYYGLMVDFDPGAGVFNLPAMGSGAAFIWQLDTDGNFVWAGAMGGNGTDRGQGIALDGSGNIYVGGVFGNTADLDPGPGTFNLTSLGSTDAMVCKLDPSGNFIWARALAQGTGENRCTAVVVDNGGNVYTTGYFAGTADFDPTAGTVNLTSSGLRDFFVTKLDSAGTRLWTGALGGTGNDESGRITVDGTGDAYVTGYFNATVDFDPSAGTYNLTSAGGNDAFVLKLDSAGSFVWAGAFNSTSSTGGWGIALDGFGDVYASGYATGAADFDPGPGTVTLGAAGSHAYVCRLTSAGAFQWAGAMGSGGFTFGYRDLDVDSNGNVYVTGVFGGTVDVDPASGTYNISSASPGATDSLIVKLEQQAIPVANGDAGETDADQVLTILTSPASATVLSNDTDSNTLAALSVSAYDATSTLGATVVVNPDGTFSYDPTGSAALQTVPLGDMAVDTFTYSVTDGTDTVVGTVTITVNGLDVVGMPATSLWALGLLMLGVILIGAWQRPAGGPQAALRHDRGNS